jgi:hemerythrin superfamily protein
MAEYDALAVLEADHRAVEQLFAAFERADRDDLERKSTLVQRACELLSIHAIVEEELLYPAAREVLGDVGHDEVDEARVEHFLVKTLIEKFAELKAGADGFDATFKVLAESVSHHVQEEESELFPQLRKTQLDLAALGKAIVERKDALQTRLTEVATAR